MGYVLLLLVKDFEYVWMVYGISFCTFFACLIRVYVGIGAAGLFVFDRSL